MARRKDGTVRGRPSRKPNSPPKGIVPPHLAENAAKWVKGMPSPNPGGRPRGMKLVTFLARRLEKPVGTDEAGKAITRGDALMEVLVQMAESGAFPALKEILDRHDGKVPDRLQGHEDGSPLRILVEHVKAGGHGRDSDSDT